jgi:hypothetical protein
MMKNRSPYAAASVWPLQKEVSSTELTQLSASAQRTTSVSNLPTWYRLWMLDSYYRDWPDEDVLLDLGLLDALPPSWRYWEEMLERQRLRDKWR